MKEDQNKKHVKFYLGRNLLLFFILFIIAVKGQSQTEKRVMSIVDFLNIPGISSPRISPDGENLLYILAESDWKVNKQVSHIWMVKSDGNDARQITFGANGEGNPQWSPDGKWISFTTKRDGSKENQIYIMRSDGGEGMKLTDHSTSVSSYQWSPDSKGIYFLAYDSLSKEEKKAKKLKDDVYALDEDYKHRHLWKISIQNKKEERITEGDFSILNFNISRNGKQVVVQRGPNPLYDNYRYSEVWIMDITGKNARQMTDNEVGESGSRLSPDGKQVMFFAFANENFDIYYNDKIFLMPTDGSSKVSVPMKDLLYEVNGAEWSEDGKKIFFVANMGSQSQVWEYNISSKKTVQLTKGKHSVSNWHYNFKLDQHFLAVRTIENPGDIFTIKKGQLTQITHHYDYLSNEYYLPKQEVVSWKGADGVTVEGMLYYPHNYESGKRYPLIVQTHGGPASSDKYGLSRSFTRYNPVLTAHGYVVIQPNYRGSTGYGDDFLRDMVGGYYRQSHLDVMAGVDYLIEKGIADPDRMVKMGWSAGGHMTNKIVTFTDRFKAASSGAGAVNWIGMYAQSDVRTYRTPWFGGTPWQKDAPIDAYWDHSPLKDISDVKTPTLVIVGENDVRVPLPQSVEMYRAIRSLGVPTHLYVAPREPHGWRELRHRLYKMNVELDWFAKYALGKDYEWEKVED